jgi:hypothetical protein
VASSCEHSINFSRRTLLHGDGYVVASLVAWLVSARDTVCLLKLHKCRYFGLELFAVLFPQKLQQPV